MKKAIEFEKYDYPSNKTMTIVYIIIIIFGGLIYPVISDMQHLTTKGYSMLPTLTPNSTYLYVLATNKTIYNAGDMVVYEVNGSRRLHRLVGVYPDKIITKGDNNKYVDEAINESQIKEVVCGIIYGGII